MSTVIAAPISDDLAERTASFVALVREADRPREHRKQGVELINELTRAGLEGYFLDSSKELGFGTVAQGAVRLGLSTASRGIGVVVRRFVSKFSDDELRKTAEILERLLISR